MRMVWASTSASAQGLNESPSEKEGKSALAREGMLGESDPQRKSLRKGREIQLVAVPVLRLAFPSMKVPPKRKGNLLSGCSGFRSPALNESPSEKEGK